MSIEHVDATDPEIHESKGVAGANDEDVYHADGAGSGEWKQVPIPAGVTVQGVYNYGDVTTETTPIALTNPGQYYQLTNDGAGAESTTEYSLVGLDETWDSDIDSFVWNDGAVLALGDTVEVRISVIITTTAVNSAVDLMLNLGSGGGAYTIPLIPQQNFKVAGTYDLIRWMGIYMGNADTLNNGGTLTMSADTAGVTVEVVSFYVHVLHTTG